MPDPVKTPSSSGIGAPYRSPSKPAPVAVPKFPSSEDLKTMDSMAILLGTSSTEEVMRRALDLFKVVLVEASRGTEVILRSRDGKETKVIVV